MLVTRRLDGGHLERVVFRFVRDAQTVTKGPAGSPLSEGGLATVRGVAKLRMSSLMLFEPDGTTIILRIMY